MNYVLFFILLLPVKGIMKLFHKKTGRNLVIQTAKIGDFINITPLLTHLKRSDALLSRTIAPLAARDETLEQIWYVEDYRASLFSRLRLAFQLLNRYDNIYLLHPNNLNLFYAAFCNGVNKQFLSNYRRKGYQAPFYYTASGVVEHSKTSLTVESYLKLADRSLTCESYPKHVTQPFYRAPLSEPALFDEEFIKIGISISAGNTAKTIPATVWATLFDSLQHLPCRFYVFGTPEEIGRLDDLYAVTGKRDNIISLIGELTLDAVPHAISLLDFYIASDTGNVYIADALNVPVILIYGPCEVKEQRPLGDVLLAGPDNIAPSSWVFAARYEFDHPPEQLFALNPRQLKAINTFIQSRMPTRLLKKNQPFS
ncbi:glycosyltransferase family 9 protein [[Erwinia] mediterraneensis]|uniref:glycosyltransferase family 9 protein n=1 Tax=[Erwinia] mediterraneensis TaxID=2161819 RepID=UPI00102FC361|nr:glycosyltransferase family 9 protein [[Erwinia] mediterraneensis]